jgi:rod shape-determining protein MreB
VASESIRIAGDEMDEAIISHMKRTYNLLIGVLTAERIKIQIGSAYPLEKELTMEVKGRDSISGLPRKCVVNSEEVREALKEPVDAICEAVKRTLERTPPELAADLVDIGMVLVGGGVLLRGLDKVLAAETGIPVGMAEDPLTCVAKGTGIFLDNLDQLGKYMESGDEEMV